MIWVNWIFRKSVTQISELSTILHDLYPTSFNKDFIIKLKGINLFNTITIHDRKNCLLIAYYYAFQLSRQVQISLEKNCFNTIMGLIVYSQYYYTRELGLFSVLLILAKAVLLLV